MMLTLTFTGGGQITLDGLESLLHPAQANEPTEENISRALYERIDRSNIVDIDGVHVNFDNVAFFQFVE